ncbi:site-specific DNA-methyltransferase [Lonepinella koalarum]|nr:site-specific DNA-methyltransferase [Lonepinella koalarum]MDH2927639.1 hypothetical protein [Lonepinella koalarum]TFJ90560.1 site-specific DNA-methyltransferase [Lonepinella koalarum]
MALLLSDAELQRHFFTPINDVFVFKSQDFRFFLDSQKIDNSYTRFANRIGLSINQKLLRENADVVLDFPFKDCVLSGGQSTEEGTDTVFHLENGEIKQSTQKRQEIFFNQVLAFDEIDRLLDPKAFANAKRINANGETVVTELNRNENGDITDNLIIKGNNLIALHTLATQFKGKVKLIYIDPPFNTGSDEFKYNDRFLRSTWLTFMKNRLEIAKELLSDNGAIFIHCDYNEDAYLRVLADEIFGTDSFIANIAVRSSTPSGTKTAHKDKKIIKQKDTILVYKKENLILKPQYMARENWDSHYSLFLDNKNGEYCFLKLLDVLNENGFPYSKLEQIDPRNEKVRQFIVKYKDNICRLTSHKDKEIDLISRTKFKDRIFINVLDNGVERLYFNGQMVSPISQGLKEIIVGKNLKEYWSMLVCDFWQDIDFQNTQNEGGVSFPTGKKPEALLYRIIDMVTEPNDIVLDFHLGSGTTAAVAHKMKRQYIGIEQMDYIETIALDRMKKVIAGEQGGISKAVNWQGGGELVYCELASLNETAKQQILATKNVENLTALFMEISRRYFLKYNVNVKDFVNNILPSDEFKALDLNEQKSMMLAMLDLNQLYLSYSDMTDENNGLSEAEQAFSRSFYGESK